MSERDTFYANTDLDLVSESELSDLIEVFRSSCHVLTYDNQHAKWFATIEPSLEAERIIDRDIEQLLLAAKGLTGGALQQWRMCTRRDLNIGIECGDTWAFEQTISRELLE